MTTATPTTWDNDPFAIRPKVPSLSFEEAAVGTVKSGTVTHIDTDVQGRDYKTGLPATWENSGDPKLSIVIGLDTDEGPHALWVTKYAKDAKFVAIAQAQRELGRVLQIGDVLKVKFTGIEPGSNGRKLYQAKIEPGQPGTTADPFAAPAKQADEPPF
jgi:hypothetical protein